MIPTIYVINLDDSIDRRHLMQVQLDKSGMDYQFFSAIDKKNIPTTLNKYDQATAERRGQPLSKGEVAVFASHFCLWEKCIAANKPIIVLEDDVKILDNFNTVVEQLSTRFESMGYIRLCALFDSKSYKISEIDRGHDLVVFNKPPAGAQGYFLSPSAAKNFVMFAQKWSVPVDGYMDSFWIHGNKNYAACPFSIEHLEIESNISDRGKTPSSQLSTKQHVRRECERFFKKILRWYCFFLYRMSRWWR